MRSARVWQNCSCRAVKDQKGGWQVEWRGKKPWPQQVNFADGFRPAFSPRVQENPGVLDVFPTFTRCFWRSPHSADVSEPDGQRFPVSCYEKHALLWKSQAWRPPTSSERAQIVGVPKSMLAWVRPGDASPEAEASKCSLLGSASHVPSCMLALTLVFQCCPTTKALPPGAYVGFEKHVRAMAQDTVWQPGLVESWPGLLDVAAVDGLARECFAQLDVQLPPLIASPELESAIAKLQVYWVDTCLRQVQGQLQGPQWLQQKQQAQSAQALGAQRGGPTSKFALPALAPGRRRQRPASRPFDASAVLDDDADFAARGMAALGPCLRAWRCLQLELGTQCARLCSLGKVLCILTRKLWLAPAVQLPCVCQGSCSDGQTYP